MATSTYDGFGRTLEKFRRTLSDEQKRAFSSTNLDDVKKAMQDIQDQIGPGKKLRNFIRLKKFLEGMKQMEELVKVFAQVHEVVAFVWGPIKLALMVAATKVEILELLLGVYQEIGDVLHGVERYTRLFQKHSEARQILETYFYDVLQFHTEVLKVFTKPGWKRLFTYAWPTFKTRFQPIIDSLKRHKGLLSDEKHTIVIEEVQELSADFKDKFAELRQAISESDTKHQESIASQKSRIIAKINPLRYESDHDLVSKKRHMSESGASGNWILQDPKFRSWVDDSSPESIFYLHGMPGSGKTTLASRIVDYMNTRRPKPEGLVVFFYFKHNFKKGTRRTVAEMLRTLLAQLLAQDDALLEYMHQQFASNSDSEPFLKGCAKHCFMSQKRAWVILDGLDECDEEYEINKPESQRVLRWFREDLFPACQAQGCQIRLLISGQRDGYVDAVLSKCPDINLDTANGHVSDIREYTKSRASFIREDFSLDSTQEADIIERVVSTSKGMFLYAKVVLDNLISQESPADLDDELKQDHFPQALDAAYERVVIRVLDRPFPSRKKSALVVLGWLTCSARPLRWREIQSRFSIDPDKATCNFRNERVHGCKAICGSLVEVEPCEYHGDSITEQTISLVHNTAARYLVETGRLHLYEEHARMAIFCTRYLSSSPFDKEQFADTIEKFALTGYYGLLDYASAFWQHHVNSVVTCKAFLDAALQDDVAQSVARLLEGWGTDKPDAQAPHGLDITFIESRMAEWLRAESDFTGPFKHIINIRRLVEDIDHDSLNEDTRKALALNGLARFKCPRTRCFKFATDPSSARPRDVMLGSPASPRNPHIQRLHADAADTALFSGPRLKAVSDIYSAALQGDLQMVKTFHENGAPINEFRGARGSLTPLIIAVRRRHFHVCAYIMQQGANPYTVTSSENYSPLGEAIKQRDLELMHFLETFHNKNEKEYTASHIVQATETGLVDILEEVLTGMSPAVIETHFRRILLDKACKSARLLHRVVSHAFPSLYELDRTTPRRHLHTERKEPAFVRLQSLLKRKDSSGDTILHDAIFEEAYASFDCAMDLLSSKDFIATNYRGQTPLHKAWHGSPQKQVQRLLLADGGISANIKDDKGNLPLHELSDSGNLEVLQILVQHTKNLDEKNNEGKTALQIAIRFGSVSRVRLLVQSGRVDTKSDIETLRELVAKADCSDEASSAMLELLDPSSNISERVEESSEGTADESAP